MGMILRFLVAFRQRVQRVLHVNQKVTLQHKQARRSDVTNSEEVDFSFERFERFLPPSAWIMLHMSALLKSHDQFL